MRPAPSTPPPADDADAVEGPTTDSPEGDAAALRDDGDAADDGPVVPQPAAGPHDLGDDARLADVDDASDVPPDPVARRGSRFAAVLCLGAAVVAVGTTIVTGAAGDDATAPPGVFTEARAAERELAGALVADDGAPATGEAIRAARETLSALAAINAGPLPENVRRARASRRVLVRGIGSVLRNPRSPLAAELPAFLDEARATADAADIPLPDLTLPGQDG